MRALGVTLAALGLGALAVLAIEPVRDSFGHAFSGDIHALRAELRGLGAPGVAVLVGLILSHAVVFFPAEVVNATAGLVYGFAVAMPLLMVAWLVSVLIAYWLGVSAGRPLALKLAGEPRVVLAERVIERGGARALLAARFIPFVPMSLVGYVAGAADVPLWRYAWTSFVGILPITAAATYFGHALDDLSPTDPLLWASVGVLCTAAMVTLLATRRRSPR